MEGTFDARRAVGVAAFMGYKAESETLSEGFHFRYGNHLASGSVQYHHVRVVDHHALRRTAHIAQRIGKKDFAVEALERGIDLEKQQARVEQNRRCGLCLILLAAYFNFVRGGVVLHFLTGLKVIAARRHNGLLPDALPAAEGCQRRIRQRCAVSDQFFMDSRKIPLA